MLVHGSTVAESCLVRNDWLCAEYVTTRSDILLEALRQHLLMTFLAVALGVLVAIPLALLARRSPLLEGGVIGAATVAYTIPSLALFVLLLGVTGLTITTVVLGLALYTLAILLRNTLAGLAQVPPDALDAARGMGLGPFRALWSVELPLAVPTIIAGVRIATVSTVSLVTVGALIGFGGLGNLIITGLYSRFNAQVLTATVLTVAVALLLDGALLLAQKLLTPWARGRAS